MHKGVIILTKAEDRQEAKDLTEEFLESYGEGDVWDWYSIGNRWNNTLAPVEKVKIFDEWINEKYKEVFKDRGYSIDDLENSKDREIIQNKWKELELKGYNPYYSAHGFNLPKGETDDYNIVPLEECIETVKEWVKDLEVEKETFWNKMIESKAEEKEQTYSMTGYYAGLYKDAEYGSFCFESNVYDATEQVAEKIPEDITEYWAVMIDMHN